MEEFILFMVAMPLRSAQQLLLQIRPVQYSQNTTFIRGVRNHRSAALASYLVFFNGGEKLKLGDKKITCP